MVCIHEGFIMKPKQQKDIQNNSSASSAKKFKYQKNTKITETP